jgi:hypothetical protein
MAIGHQSVDEQAKQCAAKGAREDKDAGRKRIHSVDSQVVTAF